MPQSPVFQRPISIGLPPTQVQGARITTPITLTSLFPGNNAFFGTVDTVDMVMEDAEGVITNIQTMYVDNSTSPSPFLITFPETQQTIWVPARSQGYWPIAIGQQGQVQGTVYLPGGTGYSCTIQFLNVPVPLQYWDTIQVGKIFTTSGSSAGNTAITITSPLVTLTPSSLDWSVGVYGFDVSGTGATAASDVVVTLGGIVKGYGGTNTLSWDLSVPVLAAGAVTSLQIRFPTPVFGQAKTNVTFTVPAFGAGNTQAFANLYWGII